MPPVKRLNYFTNQFLVEADFKDEQAYHIAMRRRLNASLHTWGVASGLSVTKSADRVVSVAPGAAIDNTGREITVIDPSAYPLVTTGSNIDVYLTIAYNETFDSADRYTSGAVDNYVRTTELPILSDSSTIPPADGSIITIARIHLDGSGNISTIISDTTVVKRASSSIAAGAVSNNEIANGAVTLDKLAPAIRPVVSIDGVSNPGGNIDLIAANTIHITPNDASNTITIGETHSGISGNPHNTTATQIGVPVSIDGVRNPGGNIDLIAANAIHITPNDAANTITIGETHSGISGNPHNTTAAQVGALSAIAYDFKNRFQTEVAFSATDGSGAIRTVNAGFKPRFIWAFSYCNSTLAGLLYGVQCSGMVDLAAPTAFRYCIGNKITRVASVPYIVQTCYMANGNLFSASFEDQVSTQKREERLDVTISGATDAGVITVALYRRERSTTDAYASLSSFDLKCALLIYG